MIEIERANVFKNKYQLKVFRGQTEILVGSLAPEVVLKKRENTRANTARKQFLIINQKARTQVIKEVFRDPPQQSQNRCCQRAKSPLVGET